MKGPSIRGSVLDSTTIISAERSRQTAEQLISTIYATIGDQPIVISSIGYTELLIGLHRETDPVRLQRRQAFFDYLIKFAPGISYSPEIAVQAGRLGGEQSQLGHNIPFADLMIGATALSLDFSVLTSNVRHFRMIPGLRVLEF